MKQWKPRQLLFRRHRSRAKMNKLLSRGVGVVAAVGGEAVGVDKVRRSKMVTLHHYRNN